MALRKRFACACILSLLALGITPASAHNKGKHCTKGYKPCLHPASEYDCAGGGGNGPKYVHGTVKVTGSDPYDLDRNDNGIGCEQD